MARIYEYQGKEILAKSGLEIPKGVVVTDPDQAAQAASTIGKPVVIKAQVWVTGRFKAGGIKFADTPEAAKKAAAEMLSQPVKGLAVSKMLVEEQLAVEKEYFVGIIVSNSVKIKGPVLIFSSEGGSSVEEVSKRNPERIANVNVDYLEGITPDIAGRLLDSVTFDGGAPSKKVRSALIDAIVKVYEAFKAYDCRAIEINPLILTKDQRIIAADCHLTLDDNAVFRHPEIGIKVPRDMDREPTELEQKAWAVEEGDYRGTGYFSQMAPVVEGPGWLGFQGIGGGGAMLGATAFVARGFKIANYADTSGDPPASKIYIVLKHILSQEIEGYVLMGACLANQEQWHHAHALVKAFREEAKKRPGFPVIILLAGNKEKETHEIIKEGFKDLPLRWELYGREYIYNTDFIADRVEALVKAYKAEQEK
jgi:succinyl-CoA synthetase beta subunit